MSCYCRPSMLTFSVSLQSSSCKSVVPCMRRLHQFLSALALGLGLIKLMQPLHAWYNYYLIMMQFYGLYHCYSLFLSIITLPHESSHKEVETSFFLGNAQSWRWTTAAVAFLGTNFSSGSTSSCLSGRLAAPLRHP